MRQDQLEMLKGLWDREGVPYECGTPLARYTTFKIGGPAGLPALPMPGSWKRRWRPAKNPMCDIICWGRAPIRCLRTKGLTEQSSAPA